MKDILIFVKLVQISRIAFQTKIWAFENEISIFFL